MLPAERDGQPDPEPVFAGHVPAQDHGLPVLVQAHEVGTTYHDGLLDGRIGKVAISPSHEGLQVDGSNFSSSGDTSPDDRIATAPEVVFKTGKESTTSLNPPDKSKSRKKLIFLVIGLILVTIAAVLGGVLGSRTVGGSTSTSPRTSDTTNTTTPDPDTPSLIKQRSSLSVTAWRNRQGGLQTFLYYQSSNGTLRWSTYNDTQNADTYSNSYWGESKALGSLETDQAANDTGLAATMILWNTTYMPQINVFYVQSGAALRAKWNVNSEATYHQYKGFNTAFEDDHTARGSTLAGYWPYYARLDEDNAVTMWRDDPRSDFDSYETGNWSVWFVSKANAMAGSQLAVVPTGPNMTSLASWNYGLFYQATTGELALIQPHMNDAKANNTFIDSWSSDTGFPSIPLAPGGSFAAFATARPDSSEGLVNTYVLYQEPSSRISMVYLDNKSQWVVTHPEALSIADNGTSIACVTMPMTQRDADGKDLPLETASNHANRCYFQRAGYVIEVVMNGTDWTELGTVPIG